MLLEQEFYGGVSAGLLHGLVVAGGTSESVEILHAFGHAAVHPKKQIMEVDSIFDIASLTKVIATVSACALLIDRGMLVPSAPIVQYFPSIDNPGLRQITVSDLASHYSGFDNRKFDSYGVELVDEVLQSLPQWPARDRFEYSCINYIILGEIVERISGQNLADYCRDNIFIPMGMKHTNFGPINMLSELLVPSDMPPGVISDEQARVAGKAIGNAGLFSNVPDLSTYCQTVLQMGKIGDAQIFGDASLYWMTNPCSPSGMPLRSFGWDMQPESKYIHRPSSLSNEAIGHTGFTGQSLWIDPKLNLFAVVLTNRGHQICDRNNIYQYEASKCFRSRIAEIVISQMKQKIDIQ